MIASGGSIPFPPNANPAPINALAANLQQLAAALSEGGTKLDSTAQAASRSWVGTAAAAYMEHTNKRARTVAAVGAGLGKAPAVLRTFASAISSAIALYNTGVATEKLGQATSWSWGAALIAKGKAIQMAAVASLQAAGGACAGALVAIEAEVAAAQFLGVDKSTLSGLKEAAGSIWENVVDLVTTGDTDAAVSALDHTIDVIGLVGILANGSNGSSTGSVQQAQQPQLTAAQQTLVDVGYALKSGKYTVKPITWALEGAAEGLEHGAHEYSQTVHRRNGTVYTRWTVAGRGSSLGITQQQAMHIAERANRWMRPLPAVGAALDGAVQYTTDQANPNLTTTQRVARTGTAAAVQGLSAWAGAAAGAKAGILAGGAVGAVPGAIVGGVVGAVGGGLAGSAFGKWVKDELFAWNPGGAYQ